MRGEKNREGDKKKGKGAQKFGLFLFILPHQLKVISLC